MKYCLTLAVIMLLSLMNGSLEAQQKPMEADNQWRSPIYDWGQKFQHKLLFDSAIFYYKRVITPEGRNPIDKRIIKVVEKRILECESGLKLISNPREFVITNLGPEINSQYEDYAPILNGDANLLIFTSRRQEGNLNVQRTTDGKPYEDIYFSKRENQTWSIAQNLGPPVNTMYHDSDLALSADGKQLFLYTDKNEGDILVSRLTNGKWSVPERLPWPINTPYHESSVSLTEDGKKLFVASERPGGFGGSDIYVFEKKSTGQWSPPINLGPSINTAWDEDSPFIDYDGHTLYFSSEGHNSMGGHDIFRSRDSLTKWSAAENLGYPINTPGHDSYFTSTRDGKSAYFSSARVGGFGAEDIYHIGLPKELTREAVGSATDSNDKPTVTTMIIYFPNGSSTLDEKEFRRMSSFAEAIKGKPYRIQVDGHTDSKGVEESNKELSRARARAVKSYFESIGVKPDNVVITGWGAGKPAADNTDEKNGRALNRRVEVRVIIN